MTTGRINQVTIVKENESVESGTAILRKKSVYRQSASFSFRRQSFQENVAFPRKDQVRK